MQCANLTIDLKQIEGNNFPSIGFNFPALVSKNRFFPAITNSSLTGNAYFLKGCGTEIPQKTLQAMFFASISFKTTNILRRHRHRSCRAWLSCFGSATSGRQRQRIVPRSAAHEQFPPDHVQVVAHHAQSHISFVARESHVQAAVQSVALRELAAPPATAASTRWQRSPR